MNKQELNRLFSSIIVVLLIIIIINKFANFLYKKNNINNRGYVIAVPDYLKNNTSNLDANLNNIIVEVKLSKDEIEKLISEATLNNARLENGKKLVKRCISCHTFEQGGINKIGPNLFAIIDRKKASNENYYYSASLNKIGGSWALEDLFHFLHNPKKFAPNTKMVFPGFAKTEDIVDIILFLQSNK